MNKQINENHISLLTRAFAKDPMFIHLFSNQKRERQMKSLIRFIIKRNHLLDGLILTDHATKPSYIAIVDRPSNLTNVSIKAKINLNIEMLLLVLKLPFRVLRYLTKYQKVTFSNAPNEPHYYLTMIGVDPSYQGKGIGKKVLKQLDEIAASSPISYSISLDTENQQNVAFYERFGYELRNTTIIDGLSVYCMTKSKESNHYNVT
ncbi:GNAT family N-acetyltransferase [Gracilibacillus lacisalsi]|uniref:GNAT family N-acetyltransferase n=1 Tax=Gracilibacillus lacisalsi TaxID=393087 RepID=UPI00037A0417|nr:N-acetyltransferase [Gracilibacillus lacisalsi]